MNGIQDIARIHLGQDVTKGILVLKGRDHETPIEGDLTIFNDGILLKYKTYDGSEWTTYDIEASVSSSPWSRVGVVMSPAIITDRVGIGLNNPNNLFQVRDHIMFHPTNFSTHFGFEAGHNNVVSERNVFIGYQAGYSLNATKTDDSIFIGYKSGYNTSVGNNVMLGSYAGISNEEGSLNTLVGIGVSYYNISGSNNTIIGTRAGSGRPQKSSDCNTFLGGEAGYNIETGSYNVFLGYRSGYSNSVGAENVFSGNRSGYSNTEGSHNVFSGHYSGYSNVTGDRNVFLGYKAGYNETDSDKLYIANSDTAEPLIGGDFDAQELQFNVTSLNISNLPTSATGLSVGDIWISGTDLKIVI